MIQFESLLARLKSLIFGRPKDIEDPSLFHRISLIAFLGWVGLGADGLSSSCYGPEEMFLALGSHTYLAVFVAAAAAVTIFIISASYSQTIELFPTGGGSYVVTSKLLSPTLGMVAGCALLVDYVLTITISIAAGADALFSFLPYEWNGFRIWAAFGGVILLMVLNLRGAKESVIPLVPVFLVFLITHTFAIIYSIFSHADQFPVLARQTVTDLTQSHAELGLFGILFLLMHAFSMGAGTFTGIEAVSNGLPILREPRVETGKRTMLYMAVSLAFTASGLIVAYLLFQVTPEKGKTLNAVLFEQATAAWPASLRDGFLWATLISEATLLFVAAQAGFLDGPRVLSNMALDRWVPGEYAALSDRFVMGKGVLMMGTGALLMMLFTAGSVRLLVVLYSINVFITFVLSQAGMVRHWWQVRGKEKGWLKKLLINGTGMTVCAFILFTVVVVKFTEGGWVTILVTGSLMAVVTAIRAHYRRTEKLLARLEGLVQAADAELSSAAAAATPVPLDPKGKTAVLLVNGYNGLGLHTLFNIPRVFGDTFRNYVFIQVGLLDAGNFKGVREIDELERNIRRDLERYVRLIEKQGRHAEYRFAVGTDLVEEIVNMAPQISKGFPNPVFFGGQLVFPDGTLVSRWLHSFKIFSIQQRLYYQGIPLVVLPVRV